jgi:hypothetical protein
MSFRVWFYNPDKEHTTSYNVINKLVAGLTPPFCHVELQFPDETLKIVLIQHAIQHATCSSRN